MTATLPLAHHGQQQTGVVVELAQSNRIEQQQPPVPQVQNVVGQQTSERKAWQAGLFDCCNGGTANCLYACCCPQCAGAHARHEFDNSNFWFNLCCVGLTGSYNIVREGKHISGNCLSDMLTTLFCGQCAAARLLNEPYDKTAQSHENMNTWEHGLCDFKSQGCGICLRSCCCPQCVAANARTNFDGSNWWFNLCCLPQAANYNIVREGLGIKGDCLGDVLTNVCCPCCAAIQVYGQMLAHPRA